MTDDVRVGIILHEVSYLVDGGDTSDVIRRLVYSISSIPTVWKRSDQPRLDHLLFIEEIGLKNYYAELVYVHDTSRQRYFRREKVSVGCHAVEDLILCHPMGKKQGSLINPETFIGDCGQITVSEKDIIVVENAKLSEWDPQSERLQIDVNIGAKRFDKGFAKRKMAFYDNLCPKEVSFRFPLYLPMGRSNALVRPETPVAIHPNSAVKRATLMETWSLSFQGKTVKGHTVEFDESGKLISLSDLVGDNSIVVNGQRKQLKRLERGSDGKVRPVHQ
jgi:hypothetical protein